MIKPSAYLEIASVVFFPSGWFHGANNVGDLGVCSSRRRMPFVVV
jgi:hypothetical protein